jgi:predicted restriction endonuclease
MAVHAHHIEHRANGGSNHVSNMITLCPNHHALAHAGHLSKDELKSYISRLPTTIIVPR